MRVYALPHKFVYSLKRLRNQALFCWSSTNSNAIYGAQIDICDRNEHGTRNCATFNMQSDPKAKIHENGG